LKTRAFFAKINEKKMSAYTLERQHMLHGASLKRVLPKMTNSTEKNCPNLKKKPKQLPNQKTPKYLQQSSI
jgi:hypothetical protein